MSRDEREPSESAASAEGDAPSPGTAAETREEPDAEAGWQQAPIFSPGRLAFELGRDAALRWLVVAAVVGAMFAAVQFEAGAGLAAQLAVLAVVGGWLAVNALSARSSRDLPRIAALIAVNPVMAEDQIARHLRRWPLVGWVRLMLYHRLAGLRHRQQRYGESAAICAAVLQRRLGPAGSARSHLLLLLSEAALEERDLHSAYFALSELYRTRLSLAESLQRMALQTRYEVAAGRYDAALGRAMQKVELAELMPAAQCGAVHALLATAASEMQREDLAKWLWQRARLLCTPEQFASLQAGGLGLGVVEAAPGE